MRLADLAERVIWHAGPLFHWTANPFRLVSLWEMLRFNAPAFLEMMQALAALNTAAHLATPASPQDIVAARRPEAVRADVGLILASLSKACQRLALTSAVAKISRLHQELDSSVDATDGIRTCTSSFKELSERIRDDLQARLFLWIPPERSRFYSQKKLFGKLV